MRDRINGMRELLVKTLKSKAVLGDYSFITRQRGMFSFSGLTPDEVEALKQSMHKRDSICRAPQAHVYNR